MKLKGSALLYVLIITLVMTLMTLAAFATYQYHQKELAAISDIQRSIRNAESGLVLLRSDSGLGRESEVVDLFGDEEDYAHVFRFPWGAYEVLVSEGISGRETTRSAELVGSVNLDTASALTLIDHGKPLSLCGKTRLEGTCYLPRSGVKRAYIEGKNYVGSDLVYGERLVSAGVFPESRWIVFKTPDNVEALHFDELQSRNIDRSFHKTTLLIWSEDEIYLDRIEVNGNIIVKSDTRVIISESCELQNCIVQAPEVIIEDGFIGAMQVFSNNVIVGDNVSLRYPSSIFCEPVKLENGVSIGANSTFVGEVQLRSNEGEKHLISIESQSRMVGTVITNSVVELKGVIEGELITEGFLLRTPSATYRNHLLDATVSRLKAPSNLLSAASVNSKLATISKLK